MCMQWRKVIDERNEAGATGSNTSCMFVEHGLSWTDDYLASLPGCQRTFGTWHCCFQVEWSRSRSSEAADACQARWTESCQYSIWVGSKTSIRQSRWCRRWPWIQACRNVRPCRRCRVVRRLRNSGHPDQTDRRLEEYPRCTGETGAVRSFITHTNPQRSWPDPRTTLNQSVLHITISIIYREWKRDLHVACAAFLFSVIDPVQSDLGFVEPELV